MNGPQEPKPRRPAPTLAENDYTLIDYLIARAIDSCVAERRKAQKTRT